MKEWGDITIDSTNIKILRTYEQSYSNIWQNFKISWKTNYQNRQKEKEKPE